MELPYKLRMLIRDNTATADSEEKIIEAVEAHCEAIMANSQCYAGRQAEPLPPVTIADQISERRKSFRRPNLPGRKKGGNGA